MDGNQRQSAEKKNGVLFESVGVRKDGERRAIEMHGMEAQSGGGDIVVDERMGHWLK